MSRLLFSTKNQLISFFQISVISAVVLANVSSVFAQNYTQFSCGAGYAQQAYIKLATANTTQTANTSWDLAFSAIGMQDGGVFINESSSSGASATAAIALYDAPTANWADAINSADLTVRRYNPEINWQNGAFNETRNPANPLDFGWGTYNPALNEVTGNKVFAVKLRNATFKKVQIVRLNASGYTLRYANLDGSNEMMVTIPKTSPDQFLVYFSFASGIVTTIPTGWDLQMCRYTTEILDNTGVAQPYVVVGILSGKGVQVARATAINPATVAFSAYADSLSSEVKKFGSDWKAFNTTWSVPADRAYFVKTAANRLFKLIPIDFEGSGTGTGTFEKVDLGNFVSTNNVKTDKTKLNVYPTLASDFVTVAIAASQAAAINLQAIDTKGSVAQQLKLGVTEGLNVFQLNTTDWAAGTYVISLQTNGEAISQKIVVAH